MWSTLIATASLVALSQSAPSNGNATATILFQNGSIYTLDSSSSKASALAVGSDGTIIFVGSEAGAASYITNSTKLVNLHGRAMIPGLVDAHMHTVSGGLFLLACDLNYQPLGLEEILAHVQQCIDDDPEKEAAGAWLEVVNMDYPSLVTKSGAVDKTHLDQLKTNRAVSIRASDYHTVLANSRALELSDITAATPDPPGGLIERLPGSNEPSGVLQDSAGMVLLAIPPPTDEENVQAGRAALQLLRQNGITTFQEASAGEFSQAIYQPILQEGGLSARAYFDYRIEAPNGSVDSLVANTVRAIRSLNDNSTMSAKPTLKWQAIKAFIDGVITYPARTAAVIEPYWSLVNGSNTTWAPDPSTMNEPYWNPEVLAATLSGLFLEGIDAQLHVDGDLAVRVGLDAAEAFRKAHPDQEFRLGLAHDELSHPDDWARFAELGVDAIMSFQWAQLSSFYIPSTFASLADYRLNNLQAYAQIEKAGRPVVYGSDWPIDPLDEFLALKVAVTRAGDPLNPNSPASQGPPFDGIFPGEGISREAALRAITVNSAKFLRADKYIGSLEVGKFADVIVLEKNYFEVPEEELGRQKVLMTAVGGEVVYLADDAGQGFEDITAKFPNDEPGSTRLARRAIGGLDRKKLSKKGARAAAKLRKRHGCVH